MASPRYHRHGSSREPSQRRFSSVVPRSRLPAARGRGRARRGRVGKRGPRRRRGRRARGLRAVHHRSPRGGDRRRQAQVGGREGPSRPDRRPHRPRPRFPEGDGPPHPPREGGEEGGRSRAFPPGEPRDHEHARGPALRDPRGVRGFQEPRLRPAPRRPVGGVPGRAEEKRRGGPGRGGPPAIRGRASPGLGRAPPRLRAGRDLRRVASTAERGHPHRRHALPARRDLAEVRRLRARRT